MNTILIQKHYFVTTSLSGALKDIEKSIIYIIHGVIILFIPSIKGIAGTTRGGYGKVRGDNWDETRLPHGSPRLAVNKDVSVNGVGNESEGLMRVVYTVHLLLSFYIVLLREKYPKSNFKTERRRTE
jgi:hypothetical protein